MSVSITFEPSGISGLVAEGTYLIDAARRMGAPLGTGCTAGKSECPACLVSISSQTAVLSAPSATETKWLGEAQLAQSVRLACQVKIETAGDIVVTTVVPEPQPRATQNEPADLRKKFGDLPLEQKIATLLQLEAVTMSEAFNAAIEKPLSLGTRALDAVVARTRTARERMRQKYSLSNTPENEDANVQAIRSSQPLDHRSGNYTIVGCWFSYFPNWLPAKRGSLRTASVHVKFPPHKHSATSRRRV